jgi:hypothetical protein
VRCVRHRCVAAPPLPIPLPFPQLFTPAVGRHGDVWGLPGHADPGQVLGASVRGGDVESVPVLSRMYASAAAAGYARRQLEALRGARPCPTDNILLQILCVAPRRIAGLGWLLICQTCYIAWPVHQ